MLLMMLIGAILHHNHLWKLRSAMEHVRSSSTASRSNLGVLGCLMNKDKESASAWETPFRVGRKGFRVGKGFPRTYLIQTLGNLGFWQPSSDFVSPKADWWPVKDRKSRQHLVGMDQKSRLFCKLLGEHSLTKFRGFLFPEVLEIG